MLIPQNTIEIWNGVIVLEKACAFDCCLAVERSVFDQRHHVFVNIVNTSMSVYLNKFMNALHE